jgi:hypothetical protein
MQIEIDGVKYQPVQTSNTRKQIIVAHRGFVFVGDVSDEGDEVVITGTQNVRRWGTTYGLGQLAKEGPQEETQLDESGTVRLHKLAVVCRYDCEVASWK